MIFIVSLIMPVFAFFFEMYPRLENRQFGVDIWTHLLYLHEYHKQKKIPGKIENGFIISGQYDYPPAFIFILSRIPFHLVENYEFLFSPFFDSLHILIIFFISYYFTGSIFTSIVTQAIYAITPIIVLENSSATPRSLGYLLFTIVFISLFLFHRQGFLLYYLIALGAGTGIFLSHRFTSQGFLFFSLLFSVIDKNIIYFETFLVSFLLAIILSRGFYLKVLQGHIGNLKFWYANISYRFAHQIKGNYKTHKTQDFVFALYNQFLKFPPFVLAITNPWILVAFTIFYFIPKQNFIQQQFIIWVSISYVISLLTTWIPQLRFLGEGQRYLELSAFPAAFLSTEILQDTLKTRFSVIILGFYAITALACITTIIIIQRKAIIKDTLRTISPSMREMFAYLKSLRPKPRLLCFPHQITTNVIYHTGCPVFVNADYKNINKISDVFPYLKKPISDIMKKYNLDMIVLNEDYALIGDLYLKRYTVIKRFNNFVVIKLY